MDNATSEPKRCTVCGEPLRPDNEIGICANQSKPDCVRARKREYRSRNPQPYEPVLRPKQCEICGKPLRADNQSGLCTGTNSPPCLARRNKLARQARLPAGYEPRRCEICGSRIKDDNETGVCSSRARPECKKEHQRRLRERKAGPKRKRVTVATGDVFGKWTVLEGRSGNTLVPVRCECGTEKDILIYNLTRSVSRSCGCLAREAAARRFPDPYIRAGSAFGRLTVMHDVRRSTDSARCRCECGTEVTLTRPTVLKRGTTRSCGCLRRELNTTHGLSRHPLYSTWKGMLYRCADEGNSNYGGREKPVRVCDSWMDPGAFVEDIMREIGLRPAGRHLSGLPLYTLDRIDNDGDYEPGNVKWSTQSEQVINQRKVAVLDAEVERLTQLLAARSRETVILIQDALF